MKYLVIILITVSISYAQRAHDQVMPEYSTISVSKIDKDSLWQDLNKMFPELKDTRYSFYITDTDAMFLEYGFACHYSDMDLKTFNKIKLRSNGFLK